LQGNDLRALPKRPLEANHWTIINSTAGMAAAGGHHAACQQFQQEGSSPAARGALALLGAAPRDDPAEALLDRLAEDLMARPGA
jgi:hypothetical protein